MVLPAEVLPAEVLPAEQSTEQQVLRSVQVLPEQPAEQQVYQLVALQELLPEVQPELFPALPECSAAELSEVLRSAAEASEELLRSVPVALQVLPVLLQVMQTSFLHSYLLLRRVPVRSAWMRKHTPDKLHSG